jgi:hypothetical protein
MSSIAEGGVMKASNLVEGENSPTQQGILYCWIFYAYNKKFWNIGKPFVLDSGFCVLQGIVMLQRLGVFSAAFIQKYRY